MSTENVISVDIPAADIQTVEDALATIQTTLAPYLLALTSEQRKTIPKMGDGTVPFVDKVMDYAVSDSMFVPPYMDVPEMSKDFAVVSVLMPLLRTVDQLQSNLSDTTMMAGSEAYVAALSYYNSVKMAAKQNVPGAKAIHDDLKKRFAK
ncbi:hypothetical protein SAMN04488028_103361 [Reichenbachiella agariperforans]|uniref:Uncharacterized protein n=1 Tax=Reichenbachiella agariperforans TaxID=156994 RepID=A0A1M6QKP7_REIAG|nr:hypothetical protein [Reichenbachiella agariperforans]SHK20623.1 hypothetical protein SAMN04488028_103361 [Reichenbachiella agariperforans]